MADQHNGAYVLLAEVAEWTAAADAASRRRGARSERRGSGAPRQRDRDDELAILDRNIYARLKDMILGKTAAWLLTGSISVLAALVDSLMDAAASLINLVAVRVSLAPPDEEHRFGHGKAEPLAAVALVDVAANVLAAAGTLSSHWHVSHATTPPHEHAAPAIERAGRHLPFAVSGDGGDALSAQQTRGLNRRRAIGDGVEPWVRALGEVGHHHQQGLDHGGDECDVAIR